MRKTFSMQDSLPKLPVPSLTSTYNKLLEWVEPLVTKEQFQQTKNMSEHFFEESGEAEKLQEKLLDWDRNSEGSWLTPLWKDMYLRNRQSLPLTANFNVLLQQNEQHDTIAELVGKVSYLVTTFYHEIIDETLPPVVQRNQPLDMSQYSHFFRSVRIPRREKDELVVAPMTKRDNHIVVLHQNNVYKVPVTMKDGTLFDYQQIAMAVDETILHDTASEENVGVFTAAEREQAAEIYKLLSVDEMNVDTLGVIAEALVVISIDQESTQAKEAIKNLMLHAENKYFDKTIQIVLTQSGQIGFNIEHTAVDGTSISTLIEHISNGVKALMPWKKQNELKPEIERKHWQLTTEVKRKLSKIEKAYEQQTTDYSLLSKTFLDFGSEQIKALHLSPDAFFHIALQVAQYRTYGEMKSVYEPVSVRIFKEGRTECARATSMEKVHFVKALESGSETKETLYGLLQKASDAHTTMVRESQRGLGVERHLYGLEQMYYLYGEDLDICTSPTIFQDEGYQKLQNDFISTSGMNYQDAQYRMFAPVTQDGHGLAYMLHDYSITINMSSFMHNAVMGNMLKRNLIEALRELKTIAQFESTFDIA